MARGNEPIDFDRFRRDFAQAVKGLEEKYGVDLSFGRITYTNADFRTKLTAVITKAQNSQGKSGDPKNAELSLYKLNFQRNRHHFNRLGIKLGHEFDLRNKHFKIVGASSTTAKSRIAVQDQDGTIYTMKQDSYSLQAS